MRWLVAGIVAVVTGLVADIWLSESGALMRGLCTAVALACWVTGFIIWFRESQR